MVLYEACHQSLHLRFFTPFDCPTGVRKIVSALIDRLIITVKPPLHVIVYIFMTGLLYGISNRVGLSVGFKPVALSSI